MGAANESFDFTNARLTQEASYLGEEQEKTNLITSLQKEVNKMTMDYLTATEKEYSSTSLTDLQNRLDELQNSQGLDELQNLQG